MKKIAVALFATIVATLTVTTVGSPAEAAVGCITRSEASHVTKGMSITKAHRIIGGTGKQVLSMPAYPSLGMRAEQTREYKQCGTYGFSQITYVKKSGVWYVKSKFNFWAY